jgi:hypothetical protein
MWRQLERVVLKTNFLALSIKGEGDEKQRVKQVAFFRKFQTKLLLSYSIEDL